VGLVFLSVVVVVDLDLCRGVVFAAVAVAVLVDAVAPFCSLLRWAALR